MSTHSRTNSESSYEYVKTDEQLQELLPKEQEEKNKNQEVSDVLSFNGDISSEVDSSDESSDEDAVLVVSEEETIIENDETEESEKSETVSLQVMEPVKDLVEEEEANEPVINSLGEELNSESQDTEEPKLIMTLEESLKTEEPPVSEKSESMEGTLIEDGDARILEALEERRALEEKEKKEKAGIIQREEVLQSDPLGALETPVLVKETKEKEVKEPSATSMLLAEITHLRYEVDKIKRVQAGQKEKLAQFERNFERQRELERERDAKINPPIQNTICGEWRLINMKKWDDQMKKDGITFPNRWKTLTSHIIYEFNGFHLSSSHKLCCKTFNHSSLKLGYDWMPGRGTCARTFVRDKTLCTVWRSSNGEEKKERFIRNGQLHIVHTGPTGESTTKIYERVNGKRDVLYSFGNASIVYLKFW